MALTEGVGGGDGTLLIATTRLSLAARVHAAWSLARTDPLSLVDQLIFLLTTEVITLHHSPRMALITSDCDAMRVHKHQMALITSECDAMRVHEHQMALITSDCECSVHVAHIDYRPA